MKTARQEAFEILNKIQRDKAYSNLALDSAFEKSSLNVKDKRLAGAIVYGVIERKLTLDYQLKAYLSQPLKKLKPQVLTALRMGAYQLLFMDKIPAAAAVNESVKLAKNNSMAFAAGLINAVLHKIEKNGLILPDEEDAEYLSVKYSCADWLCRLWTESYGSENAKALLNAGLGPAENYIRVNALKTDAHKLKKLLADEGIEAEPLKEMPNVLKVLSSGALHKTECYRHGLFHVQDLASQLCCQALGVREEETVLDVCAAPGGKSFTLAQMMNNTGRLYSMDVYGHRLKLIDDGAKRLGIFNISTGKNDAAVFNSSIPFADKILCDVPCSGLGVIRKKPEIRYKDLAEVDKLPDLQYSILSTASKYVKDGGTLVYSTCSLNPQENENVVMRFLREHSDFTSVRVLDDLPRAGENTDYISLMPHIHSCDGFFIAALKKNKDV